MALRTWNGPFHDVQARSEEHSPTCEWEISKEGQYYTISFYEVVDLGDGQIAFIWNNKYMEVAFGTRIPPPQLFGTRKNMVTAARFLVEETVRKRTVRNVVFDRKNAKVIDFLQGLTLESVLLTNDSSHVTDLTHTFTYTEDITHTWNSSVSVGVGISTEFKTGVPFIAEDKISVSASIDFTTEWGKSVTESKSSTPGAAVKMSRP
ncbi:hypothetical protein BGZ59_011138, partial [Podila verticillata]